MKFAYSWLKDLVDIKLTPEKLAEFLALHAFETEIIKNGQEFKNIIVAKVAKIEKHPNADRLRAVTLTDGKNTIEPVVCGAWNFEVGAVVALALPGAVIPHNQHDPDGKPFTLAKATIRGVESQGMICSAKELGLGPDGGGIMLLNSNYKLGENFSVNDRGSEVILDVSVPANRPDIISYRGLAWEIAALTGGKYKVKRSKSKISNLKSKVLQIRISDQNQCKKYIGVRLGKIKIGESPKFIQDRLKFSGLRPINNVVDITNYVMLEVGQPLHAFDAAFVKGPISIRRAYLNETTKTLDNIERKLTTDMLVIADTKKPLAVAGVIGGFESAVGEFTNEIILEAANFNSVSVRRTARALGLRTDASSRFEKSLPVGIANIAASYAVELLMKYAQAKPLEYAEAGVKTEKTVTINFDPEKVNDLLGTNISPTEQKKILKQFGFVVTDHGPRIIVTVPFWRPDVQIWQDLAEEIARFVGLNKIDARIIPLPSSSHLTDPLVDAADRIKDLLAGMGFDEAYTYSFVPESFLEKYGIDKKTAVEIANPMSTEQKYLRLGIGMNFEQLIRQNAEQVAQQSLFEIGNVYRLKNGEVEEHTNLFLMCFSKTEQPAGILIGATSELFNRLGIKLDINQTSEDLAEILANGENIGSIRAANEELKWAAAELNFENLSKHIKPRQFETIIKYPAIELDVAMLVRSDLPWAGIKKAILSGNQKLLSQIILLEASYKAKDIPPDKKSVTFRLVYQSPGRTLTKDEVNEIHSQILGELKSKFHAEIRD